MNAWAEHPGVVYYLLDFTFGLDLFLQLHLLVPHPELLHPPLVDWN